ncbi:hypothetical protein XENOCAPTIV_017850 [Xenoophorus captivus]|uniref:Uncharacterized protein n=1 Tax=Xenoophorus captivus TaxID=1517983 RepID=A0ABV0RTM9_9TELE
MLMLEIPKSFNVFATTNLEDSFKPVCFSPTSESCLLFACSRCLNKYLSLSPKQRTTPVKWTQWKCVRGKQKLELTFTPNCRNTLTPCPSFMSLYQDKLRNETTILVHLVRSQTKEYRNMMANCDENTVNVHVDFSEAWKCKISTEVQSCHYGQNRPQITLHIGMLLP